MKIVFYPTVISKLDFTNDYLKYLKSTTTFTRQLKAEKGGKPPSS
jgi:hypothetical protein